MLFHKKQLSYVKFLSVDDVVDMICGRVERADGAPVLDNDLLDCGLNEGALLC